jgi:hypothetical protein
VSESSRHGGRATRTSRDEQPRSHGRGTGDECTALPAAITTIAVVDRPPLPSSPASDEARQPLGNEANADIG